MRMKHSSTLISSAMLFNTWIQEMWLVQWHNTCWKKFGRSSLWPGFMTIRQLILLAMLYWTVSMDNITQNEEDIINIALSTSQYCWQAKLILKTSLWKICAHVDSRCEWKWKGLETVGFSHPKYESCQHIQRTRKSVERIFVANDWMLIKDKPPPSKLLV